MPLGSLQDGRRGPATRFSYAVGAVVVGVLLVAASGLIGLSRMKTDVDRLADHTVAAVAASSDLTSAVSVLRADALAQLYAPDRATADRLTGEIDGTAIPALRRGLRTLRPLLADEPASAKRLDQIIGEFDRFQRLRVSVERRGPDGALAPSTTVALAEQLGPVFARMQASAEAIQTEEQAEAGTARQEAVTTYRSTMTRLLGAAAAALVGGLLVMLLLVRRSDAARRRNLDQAEFAETLQVTATEDEAHELVQRYLERSLPGSAAVVLKRNNSQNRLEAATALVPGSAMADRLPGAQPRSCLALRFGRTHREDPERQPLLGCGLCTDGDRRSTCEPLLVGGQVIGSVLVTHSQPLSPDQIARIRSSVVQAAPVLANLRNLGLAEFRANNDSLTGLPNKRATDDSLKRMVAQANRSITPLAALMLDLDHFKQVNDRFGHAKGDEVLAAVGEAVRSCLRSSDFAGRFGGEELLVLLPDTTGESALAVAEKLRATIAGLSVVGVDREITVSIGIADLIQHGGDAPGLLRQADRALYAAKAAGRNRVVLAGENGAFGGPPAAANGAAGRTRGGSAATPSPGPSRSP